MELGRRKIGTGDTVSTNNQRIMTWLAGCSPGSVLLAVLSPDRRAEPLTGDKGMETEESGEMRSDGQASHEGDISLARAGWTRDCILRS